MKATSLTKGVYTMLNFLLEIYLTRIAERLADMGISPTNKLISHPSMRRVKVPTQNRIPTADVSIG